MAAVTLWHFTLPLVLLQVVLALAGVVLNNAMASAAITAPMLSTFLI
jgi:hypothetical protein